MDRLNKHPRVRSVRTGIFDLGVGLKPCGVGIETKDGTRYAVRAETQGKAIQALVGWLDRGSDGQFN